MIICTIIVILFIAALIPVLRLKDDLVPILTLNSPDNNYVAKVYLISSDKMEGTSLSVNIFDHTNRLLREDIFRQWYCVHAQIHWKSKDVFVINGVELNWELDSTEFITQPTDLCPTSSLIY